MFKTYPGVERLQSPHICCITLSLIGLFRTPACELLVRSWSYGQVLRKPLRRVLCGVVYGCRTVYIQERWQVPHRMPAYIYARAIPT